MKQYKATIAYDGTDFLGFQIQAQGRTVQGVVESVLFKIAKQPVRILGAGRTDTGVHAAGQVISFCVPWQHGPETLQKALNANLPPDIVVRNLMYCEAGNFHPRFDAVSRKYRYTILNQPLRDVFKHRYAMWVSQPLNFSQMQTAASLFVGTHDFASFGRPPQGENTVRTIFEASWMKQDNTLIFEIRANAFLYRMVRNIVGTMLAVGLGNLKPEAIKDILKAKDRSLAPPPAMPNGLSLVEVSY